MDLDVVRVLELLQHEGVRGGGQDADRLLDGAGHAERRCNKQRSPESEMVADKTWDGNTV